MTETTESPGYGRSPSGMDVHRTRENGDAYCGGEVATIGDRASSLDAVRNHGARFCTMCTHLVGPGCST